MRVLLIPSAILIPKYMRARFGAIATCMFPLNGKTMLERICERYAGYADRIFLIVGKGKNGIATHVSKKGLPVVIVEMDEVLDLGHTILRGLEAVFAAGEDVDRLYVNFADTLLSDRPGENSSDVIYFSHEVIDPDWSYFEQEEGRITKVIDKVPCDEGEERYGDVFTGGFEFSHPEAFLGLLKKAEVIGDVEMDSFYSAVRDYSAAYPFKCVAVSEWYDVGHDERYRHAKVAVKPRTFNHIEIDKERGIIKKWSDNRDKFIDEINWYLKLPPQIQYLAPRIFDYSIDRSNPYVSMEYYEYNTLHELLLYGKTGAARWERIFRKLLFIVEDMGRFKLEADPEEVNRSLREMYIDKTASRILELKDDPMFAPFFENGITVNGERFPSLEDLTRILPELIERRLVREAPRTLSIIHGDLCFSNILLGDNNCSLKVIDPRGRFGKYDIYGDQRYELAKLMHSIDGRYDYIIEDMFSVDVDGSAITFDVPVDTTPIFESFKRVFAGYMGELRDLKLIESLLFLSMIPLHSDAPAHQYAMLATGLRLLRESE